MGRSQAPRERVALVVDVVLLAAAFLVFGAGLVMFFGFHVGDGAGRAEALGVSRLAWLNLHRLPALVVAAALGLHLALNRRAFAGRWRRAFARRRGPRGVVELVLHVTFWTVALTGLAVWLTVGGSAPLAGPVPLGPAPHTRHHVVDVHNIVGLVALALAAHHVGHRWRRITRGLRAARVAAAESVSGATAP